MAHSFLSVYIHLVFSTKQRQPFLADQDRRRLWRYMAGIASNYGMKSLAAGGMDDHAHMLVSLAPDISISRMANLLKANSSRWLHETQADFAWQEGYAAFSVSASGLDAVVEYIENQAEHHKKRYFRAEYLALLKKHGIIYDPQWVFG